MKFRIMILFGVSLILILSFNHASACDGHKLKVHYIKNCGDVAKNVIKVLENSTLTLTNGCEIIPNSCGETEGFRTAIVTFQVWKNNLPVIRNVIDGCDAVSKVNDAFKTLIQLFGLPDKCPVEKMTKCADESKKANIEKFKKYLMLARGGPIKAEVKVDHNNGKSCFLIEFEVTK